MQDYMSYFTGKAARAHAESILRDYFDSILDDEIERLESINSSAFITTTSCIREDRLIHYKRVISYQLSKLSDLGKQIITKLYCDGETQTSVANELNLERSLVKRVRDEFIGRIALNLFT